MTWAWNSSPKVVFDGEGAADGDLAGVGGAMVLGEVGWGSGGDDRNLAEEVKGDKGQMMLIGGNKVHALVEYETVEATEKAVSTLNCDSDWRSGMRVKLMKHVDKYGSRKSTTGWRGGEADKKNTHLLTQVNIKGRGIVERMGCQ